MFSYRFPEIFFSPTGVAKSSARWTISWSNCILRRSRLPWERKHVSAWQPEGFPITFQVCGAVDNITRQNVVPHLGMFAVNVHFLSALQTSFPHNWSRVDLRVQMWTAVKKRKWKFSVWTPTMQFSMYLKPTFAQKSRGNILNGHMWVTQGWKNEGRAWAYAHFFLDGLGSHFQISNFA